MNLFYSSDREDDIIYITGQEAIHCNKVLRKAEGAEVSILDGQGREYVASIRSISRDRIEAIIQSEVVHDIDPQLPHLAFGIIKHPARLDWLIEKVTEVGVSRITPLLCKRSEKRKIKKERLEKIILSAAKQSKAHHFPILDDPMSPEDFLREFPEPGYIASWGPDVTELSRVSFDHPHPQMLIGPEGDFTDQELSTFVNAGYQRVNLGPKRLRAETACVVACTLITAR